MEKKWVRGLMEKKWRMHGEVGEKLNGEEGIKWVSG